MASMDRDALRRWQDAWDRFARWKPPPPSPEEAASRLAWLDEVYEIVERSPCAPPERFDDPERLARHARIRRGLSALRG
jgi:hypothetical protein